MSDLFAQATRATLRAIRNKAVPPNSAGAYIWQFRDKDGPFYGGVFNAARFAVHDPNGFADWVLGRQDPKRPLNPPHADQLEAIGLLPQPLQRKIQKHENQQSKNGTEDEDAAKAESGSQGTGESLQDDQR